MDKPDQPTIYNRYNEGEDRKQDAICDQRAWRSDLAKRVSHKALDIPMDDDMGDTNITNTKTGMGWRELAVIGSLMCGAIGGGYMLNRPSVPAVVPPVVQPVTPTTGVDTDTKYDLRFVEPK